ncbi:MAG: TolC family protein [Chthoniobacteraceae bacterium]
MKYLKVGLSIGLAFLTTHQFANAQTNSNLNPNIKAGPGPAIKPMPVASNVKVVQIPANITLDDAITIAVRQNPQILLAIQQIEQTRGQIITVRAEALPLVALSGVYSQVDPRLIGSSSSSSGNSGSTTTTSSSSTAVGADKTWNISVTATQLLYSGGQVGAAIKIAKLTLDSNYFNLRDVIDQTISNVYQQYYTVLLDRELIAVQQESVGLLQSQLNDQKNRFAAGTVPRFNVLQAEVALSNQIPLLINAKNQYVISQTTLAQTLGIDYDIWRPDTGKVKVVGNLDVHYREVNEDQAIAMARARRAFLKVQRQSILIQLQQIKVALAGYQPTLTADGGYKVGSSPFSDKLDDTVNGWFVGVNGNWNIWDSGATYGRVKTARAQLESAKATYDAAVLTVNLQVQQAIANLKEARETIQSQVENVKEALEAVRLAQERLAAGAGVQLDVLNAQVALEQARTNELQSRHDYNVALAQLDYAIGADTQYVDGFEDPLTHRKPFAANPDNKTSTAKISPKD